MLHNIKKITSICFPFQPQIFRFCSKAQSSGQSQQKQLNMNKSDQLKQQLQSPSQESQKNPSTQNKKSYFMPKYDQNRTMMQLKRQLTFKKGRYLIYLNNQNLITPFLLGLHYTIPLTYFAFLISKNPFYLTFPAALPIMFMIEIILLLGWVEHKSHHKRQIQRIYLLNSGRQIQIVYANKIRRFLKDNQKSTIHNICDFQPKYDQQIEEGRVKRYPGVRFPANPYSSVSEAIMPNKIQYGWTFRDKIFNTFVIPAKFDYADWEILSKVLNGISVVSQNTVNQGQFQYNTYPSIQQQQKNISQLRTKIPKQPQFKTSDENLLNNQRVQRQAQSQENIKYRE